ncbi:MAG: hypothetical protein ACRCS4_06925 [Flavobacterium sp.]
MMADRRIVTVVDLELDLDSSVTGVEYLETEIRQKTGQTDPKVKEMLLYLTKPGFVPKLVYKGDVPKLVISGAGGVNATITSTFVKV